VTIEEEEGEEEEAEGVGKSRGTGRGKSLLRGAAAAEPAHSSGRTPRAAIAKKASSKLAA
jgi:hypothetical protein